METIDEALSEKDKVIDLLLEYITAELARLRATVDRMERVLSKKNG